jgi:hypothetical protein
MNNEGMNFGRRIRKSPQYRDPPLRVRVLAYAQFCDWIDNELRILESRWSPLLRSDRPFSRLRPVIVDKD